MKKIALTTGGTAGHIYPALALAKELQNRGYEVIFIGTEHRMEKDIVPEKGYKFYGLDILPLNKFASFKKMIFAIFSARKILKREAVDVVIGFGNYISIPAIIAAKLLRKKIYLQEQNILMGQANKFAFRFAKKVFIAFSPTLKYIPERYKNKFIVSGNPLREEFYNITKESAREKLHIKEEQNVILVMGGSLGAKSINDAVIKNLDNINSKENLTLYWSTGKEQFKEYTKIKELDNIVMMPYFDNMVEIMAAADVVVSRSGASTISELIQLKKPSLLIPYDFVGQKENAEMVEYVDGAKTYTNETACEAIKEAIDLCEQKEILNFMEKNIEKIYCGNSTVNIVDIIEGDTV